MTDEPLLLEQESFDFKLPLDEKSLVRLPWFAGIYDAYCNAITEQKSYSEKKRLHDQLLSLLHSISNLDHLELTDELRGLLMFSLQAACASAYQIGVLTKDNPYFRMVIKEKDQHQSEASKARTQLRRLDAASRHQHIDELETAILSNGDRWSKDALATEIIWRWKLPGNPPKHSTLTAYLRRNRAGSISH